MHGVYLGENLLTVGIVHLCELWRKQGIHLVLLVLVLNLHVGEGQESG